MSRPRKPTAVLDATGAFRKNPNRRRDGEPIVTDPIGPAPDDPGKTFKQAWDDIVGNAPLGVLTCADRIYVEIAARLLVEMREDFAGMMTSRLALLTTMLGKMGMNPSDRAKLSIPAQPESDPTDGYF